MAGSNPDFDPVAFRTAIHSAMVMGQAPDLARQPLFHFEGPLASTGSVDIEHVPFDPTVTVTPTETQPSVRVPCGVAYQDTQGVATGLGIITQTRLVLTFLDVDYAQVEGFTWVEVDGDRYDYRRTEPPKGLFDVGIYTVHVLARDES